MQIFAYFVLDEKTVQFSLEIFSQAVITSSKHLETSTSGDVISKKSSNPKVPELLKIEPRRLPASLEGLNSSPALSV